MNRTLETIAMELIANSGDSRSYAFGALEEAKKGNFEKANELMQNSEKAANLAHKAQTELLFEEASGTKHDMSVLLVHAQDHLMTSILARELINELIILYKK